MKLIFGLIKYINKQKSQISQQVLPLYIQSDQNILIIRENENLLDILSFMRLKNQILKGQKQKKIIWIQLAKILILKSILETCYQDILFKIDFLKVSCYHSSERLGLIIRNLSLTYLYPASNLFILDSKLIMFFITLIISFTM